MRKKSNLKLHLITKFISALILALSLSSCGELTNRLWESSSSTDRIESFFLNTKEKKVVLIGEGKFDNIKDHYHYSLTDKEGNLFKIFEIGIKSGSDIYSGLTDSAARGSNIKSNNAWISFKVINLSEEEKIFLNDFNESQFKKNGTFSYYFGPHSKITRYPSSKEKFKNICSEVNRDLNCSPVIKLTKPWQGSINNHFTLTDISWRLLLTPPALVVDIVNYPNYLYQRLR